MAKGFIQADSILASLGLGVLARSREESDGDTAGSGNRSVTFVLLMRSVRIGSESRTLAAVRADFCSMNLVFADG